MNIDKKDIGRRLKYIREKKNLKQNYVAKRIGIHNSTLNKYESGEREPDLEILNKLADLYDVSVDWLSGRTEDKTIREYIERIGGQPLGQIVSIPILGVIRAGEPMYAEQNILGFESVPAEDVKGGEYFFLKVTGDSMTGVGIIPGSRVLVRRQDHIYDGEIGVFIVNGDEATIKRVRFVDSQIMLLPANPAYEPHLYNIDEVKVIGKVVETIIKH